MVRSRRRWGLLGCLAATVSVLALVACGGRTSETPPPKVAGASARQAAPANDYGRGTAASSKRGASPQSAAPAPAPAAESAASGAYDSSRSEPTPAPAERPGLGTEWGEARSSQVYERGFERATPERANGLAMLYYNDREGARAMTNYADYREAGNATVFVPGTNVSISLRDDGNRLLPAYYASGHTYAVGEAGQHYKIVIRNEANFEVEAVTSVDGLDVIDGRDASPNKRGYLVAPFTTIEIEGFRQSATSVAAFRFGSVRNSYAARTGTDRNVGVIGLAVFVPRGAVWTEREIQRRNEADPFPGRYATPPPSR